MTQAKSHGGRAVLIGRTQQAVGAIGILVSLALIVGVSFGWAWTTNMIANTSGGIDGAIDKGKTLVTNARTAVTNVSDRLGAVSTTANQIAGNPNDGQSLGPVLVGEIDAVEQRYLALRTAYANFRDGVATAVERVDTIGSVVPALAVPQSAIDRLQAADDRMQALDAQVMSIIQTKPSDLISGAAASSVAAGALAISQALGRVTDALGQVVVRLDALRAEVASRTDTANLGANLLAIAMILLLIYLAALHVVLLRSGRVRMARNSLHVIRAPKPSNAA